MTATKTIFATLAFALLLSCDKEPTLTDAMLDGPTIFDPSINNPEKYKVSAKYPNPTADDLSRHIIIALHGYTATTFEWQEFADWSIDSNYRVSQVLLDGHGTTFQDFKVTKWEGWVDAAVREYEALEKLGYTKISFVGSSTGGPILLELIRTNYFDSHLKPKNIFMIDGIVVPSTKTQSIANIVGPMLVYVEADQTAEEDSVWYRFKPQETVQELNELMKGVRKGLEKGMTAPQGTYVKIFQSKIDPVSNPTSAKLIYKGLKHANGTNINVQIMNSDIHVFTRLSLRQSVTPLQTSNQQDAFTQMAKRLN